MKVILSLNDLFYLCLLFYCKLPMEFKNSWEGLLISLGHEISDLVMDLREETIPFIHLNAHSERLHLCNLITVYKIFFLCFTNPMDLGNLHCFSCLLWVLLSFFLFLFFLVSLICLQNVKIGNKMLLTCYQHKLNKSERQMYLSFICGI